MSIINQMLRDLEKHNIEKPVTQLNIHAVSAKKTKISAITLVVLTNLVTAGSYFAYQYNKQPSEPINVVQEPIKIIEPVAMQIVKHEVVENKIIPVESIAMQVVKPEIIENKIISVEPIPLTVLPVEKEREPVKLIVPDTNYHKYPISENTLKSSAKTTDKKTTPKITDKQQADLLFNPIENNHEDVAINKLEAILKLDNRHLNARLLMVKMLHNKGDDNQSGLFIDQSILLFPGNIQFIKVRAQLYLKQKNPIGALKTLQVIENDSDESYLSLLASTYQQLKKFSDASKIYQRLIQIDPEQAENWVGFALSQEYEGNNSVAIDAYNQALNKNTLKESAAERIRQRLIEIR